MLIFALFFNHIHNTDHNTMRRKINTMPPVTLPEPLKVFPIKTPYLVRSDMYKLGQTHNGVQENDFFMVDTDYEHTVLTCLDELKNHPDHARVYMNTDIDGLRASLWEVAETIADDQPQYATYDGDTFTSKLLGVSLGHATAIEFDRDSAIFPDLGNVCYEHLQVLSSFEQLCDLLRLSVQEDLVIGKVSDDGKDDYMECLLVPLPSKWNPLDKVGLNFADVHAPIPNSERLVKASPRLVTAIMNKGPFVRYNWTLSSQHLPQNPAIHEYQQDYEQLDQIKDFDTMMQSVYFRVERQTLKAFPHLNRYVFIIHTYLHRLTDVLTSAERQRRMLEVLLSIPKAVRDHRSMANCVIDNLSRHLGGDASSGKT